MVVLDKTGTLTTGTMTLHAVTTVPRRRGRRGEGDPAARRGRGGRADAAIGAADLTLVSGDPRAVAEAVQLARATLRVIRANLTWAFGYNVAAIPLAASGYLNPLLAGTAMAASSLIVVSNSLRLRSFHTRRPAAWRAPLASAQPGTRR